MFDTAQDASATEAHAHRTFRETSTDAVHCEEMAVDNQRQVAVFRLDPPLALSGDVKIIVQSTGRITGKTSFVWFNTE